jgi:hypothetical protein
LLLDDKLAPAAATLILPGSDMSRVLKNGVLIRKRKLFMLSAAEAYRPKKRRKAFCNADRIDEFYSWMLPSGEDGNLTPKLPEAKSVRELSEILEDEAALNILRSTEGSLSRALARYQIDHPDDWHPKILPAEGALKSLTPDMLRKMDTETVKKLEELSSRIAQVIGDRKKLSSE